MIAVLVRVDSGVSYDHNTLAFRTENSTNLGHSMQRTPFALKFNQSSKVDSSNDAPRHSGSSYAQIVTGTHSVNDDVVLQNLNY